MLTTRALRRGRFCAYHAATLCANGPSVQSVAGRGLREQRRFLSDGMDAFMEFEREMALKRRKENVSAAAFCLLKSLHLLVLTSCWWSCYCIRPRSHAARAIRATGRSPDSPG
jgi:hypothetical protein